MKKILFVIPSLAAGGGQKSLVNMLNEIDYTLFNVDLVLFDQSGLFLNQLPNHVNLIQLNHNFNIFKLPIKTSLLTFLKEGNLRSFSQRFLYSLNLRRYTNKAHAEQYTWKFISHSIETLEHTYDAAIGYLEKSSIYFVIDKVNATKKIGWIHTNYSNSGMDPNFDKEYFSKLDNLVTVSEECVNALAANFPMFKNKVHLINNLISPTSIIEMANKAQNDLERKENWTYIVTIARLSHEKGIDLAILACKKLIEEGYSIHWSVIGDGDEYLRLSRMIKEFQLENSFFLLGQKENPYPYILQSDIYVQPSRYEGKPIAIEEAKILRKPVVVTNYKSAVDQIDDYVTGLIADSTSFGIAEAVAKLIDNDELVTTIKSNLGREKFKEREIEKLYKII